MIIGTPISERLQMRLCGERQTESKFGWIHSEMVRTGHHSGNSAGSWMSETRLGAVGFCDGSEPVRSIASSASVEEGRWYKDGLRAKSLVRFFIRARD